MVDGEEQGSIRLREVNVREADSQDGLIGDEEGGEEVVVVMRDKKKKSPLCKLLLGFIGLSILCIIILLAVFHPWTNESIPSINATELISTNTTTVITTTALPATEPPLRCAPSEIPSIGNVTTSHPFGTIEQTEWNDKLHFLPCLNAIGYNKALMDQFANWMEDGLWIQETNGLWIKENGTLKMKNETEGKDKFMKSFLQFTISLAAIQDGSVTIDEMMEYFGKELDKVKCIHIKRSELPLYLPCDDAVFSASLPEEDKLPFPNNGRLFMSYTQSKVLLFTVLLGEMKSSMPEHILQNKNSDFLNDFFSLAKNNDRRGMVKFLSERNFEEAKIIGMSGQTILKKMYHCMKELNPEPGQTWKKYFSETCLNFGDINWSDLHA